MTEFAPLSFDFAAMIARFFWLVMLAIVAGGLFSVAWGLLHLFLMPRDRQRRRRF